MRPALRLVLVPLLAAGCWAGPGLGHVRGKVTVGGRPVTAGTVVLVVDAPAWEGTSPLSPGGEFFVPAVPAGPVRAAVRTRAFRDASPARGGTSRPGGADPEGVGRTYVPTPERFEEPATSGLAYTVRAGEQVIDITLPGE